METSSKYQLCINSKSSLLYLPVAVQSKMYFTHLSEPCKLTIERMFSTKQDFNAEDTVPTKAEAKKGSFFQNMFNSLTSILVDQLVKMPASVINTLSNANNTLSVTIVPNKGIISNEFFKTLTTNKNNLSDNMHVQSIQNNAHPMDYVDAIRMNSKVHTPKDDFSFDAGNLGFPVSDDLNLCIDTEPMILFENNVIIMAQTVEIEKTESNKTLEEKIISEDNLILINDLKSRKSLLEEPLQDESLPSNIFSNMWQKVVSGENNHFQPFLQGSKTYTKRYTIKTRRKSNSVSSGRGRGRGKSQLRRNGVSQTRHRKERSKHNLYSDIQSDLEIWEEFEAYTIPISCLRVNEDLDVDIQTESPYSLSYELIDIKPKETKQKKEVHEKSNNSFLKEVKFVPECSLEEGKASCTIDKTVFRPRLISETSVDSEDSFIIFGTDSESDFNGFNCLDENEVSDSERKTESESASETESETDYQPSTHKVLIHI